MKIETKEIAGFISALHGMRSPMNSWHLNDSWSAYGGEHIEIGPKDMDLAKRLIKAGPEHCKFLRQVQVWFEADMPLYFWSEFDTYKFNTKNSCSTMHKLLNNKKEIELSDFEYSKEDRVMMRFIVERLNCIREEYLDTKDFNLVIRAKKLLPSSFRQKRLVNSNYAELINIYHQRKNHRLKEEWQDTFCKWVESLPYMDEFLNCK